MKKIASIVFLSGLILVQGARADPNYSVIGAILGATAGMVIGHNVDGISKEVAVPVFAITGGIIGHQFGLHRHEWGRYNDPCGRYYDLDDCDPCSRRYRRNDAYGWREPWGRSYPRNYNGTRDHYDRRVKYAEPRTNLGKKFALKRAESQKYELPDAHPGVNLIKVSIMNKSGIRSDVPVIRVNDQFIGPQGEVYKSLPTAEELGRRYRM